MIDLAAPSTWFRASRALAETGETCAVCGNAIREGEIVTDEAVAPFEGDFTHESCAAVALESGEDFGEDREVEP